MNGNIFGSLRALARPLHGLPAAHREGDYFADEVVIDFPSVARAVEQMRRSFMDMDETIATAVRLTPREAVDGTVVPVNAPVRCVCPKCGGRGESWPEVCSRCQGTGLEIRRHRVQVVLPACLLDGARFHFTVLPRHQPPTRVELRVIVN